MRALPGLRGLWGLPPALRLPLLLLCLLAGERRSWADGNTTASPLTSLPIPEVMVTKYSNLSLKSHNISLTASPLTSLPIPEVMMTKYSNLSLESHNFSLTASPLTSLPIPEVMMTKYSNLFLESHNISLTEHSSVPVEKNITLERPSAVELTCQFTASGDVNSVNVTWKKRDEQLKNYHVSATGGVLYTQYKFPIINSEQLGSYSCFFEEGKERRGTFNFRVPEVQRKNKPLITYVGDSVVLVCKCQHCAPLNWTWYSGNRSVQVPLDVHMNDKYAINGTNANETRLKIMQLSEDDKGSYWCHAMFQLGESQESVELVVISYLVPLKPFLGIVVEVILLVAIILFCEMHTQKKKMHTDDGKEFEQVEQLKSDDSNGIENNAPRHRKNEAMSQ
ncbi:embigin isoform X1 [Mustela erminea]|uniref:embigin isoform X1 n=1 Tax=Mustela erminea TaxID=36723 RepID=UPI0013870C0F|nr:embigin isoform X1 [Mustela erminea]